MLSSQNIFYTLREKTKSVEKYIRLQDDHIFSQCAIFPTNLVDLFRANSYLIGQKILGLSQA